MKPIKEYIAIRKAEIKAEVDQLDKKPKLVIIQVGNVEASNRYVKNKLKDCAECGVPAELLHFEDAITEAELLAEIDKLNRDDSVTGFIVQLPLPKAIREEAVIEAVDPKKDVDGFSKLAKVNPGTPQGIIDFLEFNNVEFKDKNAVVIGRSNIVGKPASRLLLERHCNVTTLHSRTSEANKRLFVENADIIVVATGHRNTIDASYKVKPTCIIMDVGMNINDEGKLCGDVEQEMPVLFKSPTPGGTGLLTRLALITNLLRLYKRA